MDTPRSREALARPFGTRQPQANDDYRIGVGWEATGLTDYGLTFAAGLAGPRPRNP
jgi:hypothetical protein